MYKQTKMLLVAGSVLAAIAAAVPFALAQTGDAKPNPELARLASRYAEFAGSDANALALVAGLRNDTTIVLAPSATGQTAATFEPAGGKLAPGNINIALSLARRELADAGIAQPSPEQIRTALNGGTIGGQTFPGVLVLRSQGMGWGQIANSLGFRLGDVVSASHSEKSHADLQRAEKVSSRPGHPDKPERAARPDKVDRPHRPQR